MNPQILRRRWMIVALLLTAVLLLAIAVPAGAADFRDKETVIIGPDEVIDDDLIVTANKLVLDGTVTGDLISFANMVEINGAVEGSMLAMGQNVIVNGTVEGSYYGGSTTLELGPEADIARNLFFGGVSLKLDEGSQVGRDVYTGAYQVIVNGNVGGDVLVGASALEVNGRVSGDLVGEVTVSEQATMPTFFPIPGLTEPLIAQGMRIGDAANVGGQINVQEVVQAAAPVSEPGVTPPFTSLTVTGIWLTISQRVGELIALLVIGALFIWLVPSVVDETANALQKRPWHSLGWGFLFLVVFPFALFVAVVLLILLAIAGGFISFGFLARTILAIGGTSLAFVVALFGFSVFMVSKLVVAYVGGRWALHIMAPNMAPNRLSQFWYLLLGAVVYELLRAIPFVGPVVALVVIVFGLGALFMTWRLRRAAAQPELPKVMPSPA